MPIVDGRVPYSKLRKDQHRGQIECELRAREIDDFDETVNWTSLIEKLKADEEDKVSFQSRSGENFVYLYVN